MRTYSGVAVVLLTLGSCQNQIDEASAERKTSAERFFRGVYGCDPTVLDDLVADDILISYPIFETVLGKPVIRGRESVKEFATGFCQRWADPDITIHEAIAEGNRVVLLWSYRARNVGPGRNGQPPTNREHGWGGISLFRFDENGKIVAEIGEESDPGPAHRVLAPFAVGQAAIP